MNAFHARFISTWTPDRLYRVYIDRGEIFFIRVGGQAGFAEGAALQLGLLGGFILRAIRRRNAARRAARAEELDRQHPSAHLSAHKHNIHAAVSAVESSSLEPPAALGAHGEHFGRWKLTLRGSKPMLLQLETIEDMTAAHQALAGLGAAHVSKVAYDPASGRFAKAPA
ncbi:MAG TPA: hypothetical protein VJV23_08010 [Candidatus Polarisedimenticolia bacterium]|nr:hypothetical protein [Candidatus Polarisedimenticolia bacterium]